MNRYSVQPNTKMLKKLPVVLSFLIACIIHSHVNALPQGFVHKKSHFVNATLFPFFYSIDDTNNLNHTVTLKAVSNIINQNSNMSKTFGLTPDISITVPYFRWPIDSALFRCRYERGDTIMVERAVIDVLTLQQFAVYDDQTKKWIINKTIILKSCIINSVQWCDPRTSFYAACNFIFQKPLIIDGCSFNNFTLKPGLIFNSILVISNSAGIKINFQDCCFNDQVIVYQNDMRQLYSFSFGDQDTAEYHAFLDTMTTAFVRNMEDSSYIAFSDCDFMKPVLIANFLDQNSIYLKAGCRFDATYRFGYSLGQDKTGKYIFEDTSLKEAIEKHVDDGVLPPTTVKNICAQKSKFSAPVIFTNNLYEKTNFSSCDFYDTVVLRGVSFTDSLVFSDIFVKKGLTVYIMPWQVNNILRYTIQASTFEKVYLPYFPFNLKDSCEPRILENGTDYYDKLIDVLRQEFKDDAFNRLQNKYEHDKVMFRLEYYDINKFGSIGNFFTFLGLKILEITVGNGYNGGFRFLRFLFFVTLLFSAIYFFSFRGKALEFIGGIYDRDDKKQNENIIPENKKKSRSFSSFVKCFWVSLIILLNPKFPYSYFKWTGGLFYFLVIEWVLGLILVSLFLIYIASTYSFVRAMVGL